MNDLTEPSPHNDPEAYLCSPKFSRKLPRCPRTGLPVSYADIGDPSGVPLLWIMPSGCSRWFAASQDPLCLRYGIRLIAVDRPGVGATPMVPLRDRIRLSCEMMVSILEYLDVKLAHVLATSAGIYYCLHLLINHPSIFLTRLNPPPAIYLIAPWSPLLPPSHPDYYSSPFAWIPSKLIETQHVTFPQLPHLARLGETASTIWNGGSQAWSAGWSYAKSWIEPGVSTNQVGREFVHENMEGVPVLAGSEEHGNDASGHGSGTAGNGAEESHDDPGENAEKEAPPVRKKGLWSGFPCCIGCTTTEYFQAENYAGVGQEHLQCLNRGPADTGPEWMEANFSALAAALSAAQGGEKGTLAVKRLARPLDVQLFWGWEDRMVPRKGQLWFNKLIRGYEGKIDVTIHDVPDGDHTDLLGRAEGIYVVYEMIRSKGQSTERRGVRGFIHG